MPVENLFPDSSSPNDIRSTQPIMPSFLRGTFLSDDTDNHDFIGDGRGKGRLTIAYHSTATSTYTVSMYGQHSADSTVGGIGNFFIGSFSASSTGFGSTAGGYETIADPFPFYLARFQKSDTAGTTNATNTVFMNFSAF